MPCQEYTVKTEFAVLCGRVNIRNNHSEFIGGGIYNSLCEINFHAGTSSQTNNNPEYELYQNTASKSGGGIWSQAGVTSFIGSYNQPLDIVENHANLDISAKGDGGAVFMTSIKATANLTNTYVTGNTTGRYGAGLFASLEAVINMSSANSACSYDRYCSKINNNILDNLFNGGGGAMAAKDAGIINVKTTLIENNNSDNPGYIAFANSGGLIVLEGNLIKSNADDTNYTNNNAFYTTSDGSITLAYNTVQENVGRLFYSFSNGVFNLFGNIINESGTILTTQATSITTINCNMINDISTIAVPMTDTIVATPIYLDAVNGDYRLSATSIQAIDVCDVSIYLPSRDLSQKFRGLDNLAIDDINGPYDLGAYEFDDGDLVYKDSFEN
jgi:hypothetical protein